MSLSMQKIPLTKQQRATLDPTIVHSPLKIEQTTIKAESYKAYLATGIDSPCAIVPVPLTIFFYFFNFSLFSVSSSLLLFYLFIFFLRFEIESYYFF